jgi:hypothetical protein
MDALITFVASVPIAVTLLVWSDVGAIQEGINERKHEANISAMPGDYHTLYDEARQENR